MNQNPTGVRERNIAIAILLWIVTFGIYGLYWIYKLHDETNALTGHRNEMHPALVVFFCIITLGIYKIYWAYAQGEKLREEARRRDDYDLDNYPVLLLVLETAYYLTGITALISKVMMQNRINQLLRMNGWGKSPYDKNRYTLIPEQEIAREYEKAEAERNAQEEMK